MWTLLLILTIPLLLILYTSSFILGGEIQGGQILLEVNRVTSKKILIVSKYIVVILSILFLYILNCLTSLVTYICFISHTEFGYTRFWELHATNVQSIVVSLVNLGFIILLASIAFYLSLNISAIMASFASLGVYFLCQLLSNITMISKFIPGYFFVVKNTLVFLEKYFDDPFRMYEALGRFYEKKGYSEISHSRMRRYEILMEFAGEQKEIPSEALSDVMLLDLYLRENLKSRPSFASDQKPYERLIWDYRKAKKIPKTAHIEVFRDGKKLLFAPRSDKS